MDTLRESDSGQAVAAGRPQVGMALRAGPYFGLDNHARFDASPETTGTGSESHPYLGWRPLARLAFTLSSLLCFSTASAADPVLSATGAKVDESRVSKIYYVDSAGADAADDDKHGTQNSPFLTIKHAVDAAVRDKDAKIGAKIIIAPGTYRESIDIPAPAGADTDAPLVIEAAERDQTIIDAADMAGWEAATWKTEGATLVHRSPLPADYAPPNSSSDRASALKARLRSELVFVNGTALKQVETAAALAPGCFSITPSTDRKNPGASLRVQLPENTDPADAVFQVATRGHGLEIVGRHNLVVRGLLFQHAANPTGGSEPGMWPSGLALNRCSNVLIEDVLSQWNSGGGLVLNGDAAAPWSEKFTLRRVRLINNGRSGLTASLIKNLLAEDCETSFNGFHPAWSGAVDATSAGVYASSIHDSTWRRHRAVGNVCRGLWWGGDCTDLLVEDAVVRDNLFSGLLIENSPGPSVVRGCFVSGNKIPLGSKPEAFQPAAVSFEASPDVTLENNVVAGNFMPQLGLRDVAERTDGVDFETGAKTTLRAERHVYRHNAFWGADATQVLCDLPVSDRTGKSDFAFYYGTLDTDENCFWNPALPEAFCTYDRTAYRRPGVTLAGWRTFLMTRANAGTSGQGDRRPEAGSLWEDPQFMEPGEGDYRLQAQSPLIDWGLPSDEGSVAQ